jgi:hypothetical protein
VGPIASNKVGYVQQWFRAVAVSPREFGRELVFFIRRHLLEMLMIGIAPIA